MSWNSRAQGGGDTGGRLGATRLAASGAVAGALVGLLEALWGLALGPPLGAAIHLRGWFVGLGLVVAADLLAGVAAGWALATLWAAWRSALAESPALATRRLRRWLGQRNPRHQALLLGAAASSLGGLGGAWLLVASLPNWIHSETFRVPATLLTLGGVGLGALVSAPLLAWPLRPLLGRLRLRNGVAFAVLGVIGLLGAVAVAWRAREFLPVLPLGWAGWPLVYALLTAGVARWWPRRPPARRSVTAAGWFALVAWGLGACLVLAESSAARWVVHRHARWAGVVLGALRTATDFDRDGISGLLGGGDCRPFDPRVHPGALERADNGLDDDCWGGDASSKRASELPALGHRLPPDRPRPRNLVLISIDALRADRMGLYGYQRPTTPNIDAWARGGVVLERFYSPSPCTRWALPLMQLSRWPSHIDWNRRPWPHTVRSGETTLAEMLRKARKTTAAVWAFRSSFGLRQGFGHWNTSGARRGARAPDVTRAATELIEQIKHRAFFMWIHYYDPHAPYRRHGQPDLPRFGATPSDRYDEEVALVDREVGKLLATLEEEGLTEQTLVALTADHGEEFGEHGGQGHWGHLYEELIRIPLVLVGPGLDPARLSVGASLADLAPTVLDLLQVKARRKQPWAGGSLVPWISAAAAGGPPPPTAERPVFASLTFFRTDGDRARAVVLGSDKLIYDPPTGLIELYDLATDPMERRNLAGSEPARVHRLMGLLLPWMAKHSPEGAGAVSAKP